MSFNYTTLGGLLSFRFINKVEDLDLEDLQELLDANGIEYYEKTPINDIEAKGADAIDENAVRD